MGFSSLGVQQNNTGTELASIRVATGPQAGNSLPQKRSETHPQHLKLRETWPQGGQHGWSVRDLLCSFRLCAQLRRKCLFRASVRTEARCGAAVTRPALARPGCLFSEVHLRPRQWLPSLLGPSRKQAGEGPAQSHSFQFRFCWPQQQGLKCQQ